MHFRQFGPECSTFSKLAKQIFPPHGDNFLQEGRIVPEFQEQYAMRASYIIRKAVSYLALCGRDCTWPVSRFSVPLRAAAVRYALRTCVGNVAGPVLGINLGQFLPAFNIVIIHVRGPTGD